MASAAHNGQLPRKFESGNSIQGRTTHESTAVGQLRHIVGGAFIGDGDTTGAEQQGIVSLTRIIRWDVDPTGAFDRARPKYRKLLSNERIIRWDVDPTGAFDRARPKYRKLLSNDPQSRQRFLKRVGDSSV
jgi:hypothetical protein